MDSLTVPASRAVSPGRVLLVASGLIGGGAVAGAIAGALGASLWILFVGGIGAAIDPSVWLVGGLIGAPFGAVLLPLAGFTALRRVPLGRLLGSTIASTALGGAIGAGIFRGNWLGGALTGFLLATGWLWHRSRRRAEA
jgi:hypothetical protein